MKHSDQLQLDVKRYLRTVKSEISCPRAQKAAFLNQLETSISLYLAENNAATLDELIQVFGSPQKIAQSFLEEASPAVLGRSLKIRRRILVSITAIVLLAAVVISVIVFIDYLDHKAYRNGYYVETIQEGGTPPPVDGSVRIH